MSTEYILPPKSLLNTDFKVDTSKNEEGVEKNKELINKTFKNHGVRAKVVGHTMGSAVTQYQVELGDGERVSAVERLDQDLSLILGSGGVRIQSPIPKTTLIGIEVENEEITAVPFSGIIDELKPSDDKLEILIGNDVAGKTIKSNLGKLPHLLVGGATGSGKSVGMNVMLNSILMRAKPNEVKIMIVDPKRVEFSAYEGIPHLFKPIVTDPSEAVGTLGELVEEMDKRYTDMEKEKVKNIAGYNEKIDKEHDKGDFSKKRMPYIVLIIDELADLMMVAGKEVESHIVRIAQLARAAGIHMILATQRPSAEVITGLISSNIISRMAFSVSKHNDSSMVIGETGAENLLGRGDMLYKPSGAGKATRIQGAYLDDDEIDRIVAHIKKQKWEEPVSGEETKKEEDEELENVEGEEILEGGEALLEDEDFEVEDDVYEEQEEKQEKQKKTKGKQPIEERLDDLLDEEPETFEGEVDGIWKPSNLNKGRAYPLITEKAQHLLEAIIYDVFTQGMKNIEVPEGVDEVFVRVEDFRPRVLTEVIVGVVDLKLYITSNNNRKKLLTEEPYKVSVIMSPEYKEYKQVLERVRLELPKYFAAIYRETSSITVVNDTYFHGYTVKPYIHANPKTKEYINFMYKAISEEWDETMIELWLEVVDKHTLSGVYEVTHKESKLNIDGNKMYIESKYQLYQKKRTTEVVITRELEGMKINNNRYEEPFNEMIDNVVVVMDSRYNKGQISTRNVQLDFNGLYGVPTKWKSIVSKENFGVLYSRAKAIGLEPQKVKGPIFTVKKQGIEVICSGKGFFVRGSKIGFIRGINSLSDLEKRVSQVPFLVDLITVYDGRRSLYNTD